MREVDVVVVGSGISGLAAAFFSANRGMRTILIEKEPRLGGITAQQSGGVTWIAENPLYETHGDDGPDSAEAALTYLRFVGGGKLDEAKAAAYVRYGKDALREAMESGIEFHAVPQYADLYFPNAPGARSSGRVAEIEPFPMDTLGEWKHRIVSPIRARLRPRGACQRDLLSWKTRSDPGAYDRSVIEARNRDGDRCSFGYGLVGAFVKACLDRGVEIRTETAMIDLTTAGGRVNGVVVEDAGERDEIHAVAGVVLAAGSYESNPALVDQLEELSEWCSPAPLAASGDALIAATAIGASVRRITPNLTIMFGYPSDGDSGVGMLLAGNGELCLPHSIIVDKEAKRFGDESFFQDLASELVHFSGKTHDYRHRECLLVFDSEYLERWGINGIKDPNALPEWVTSAGTIESLAETVGLDPAVLAETVATYNADAVSGRDLQYGRGSKLWSRTLGTPEKTPGKSPVIGPVDRAPYYTAKLVFGGEACAGLLTDANSQAVRWDGTPIEGLFAVGTTSAHTEFGIGYQAGFQVGRCITFGYRSACMLAETATVLSGGAANARA